MTWKPPIPMTSVLLLSFLLVLSGPALEGCQSASVGDTSGAKPPENAEHESSRVYKNAGKVRQSKLYRSWALRENKYVIMLSNLLILLLYCIAIG